MPDHNAAASEHAIMQQIRTPLAALPDDPVSIAARPDFPLSLRGYRREAVDDYVKRTSQLVAELHAARSPEIAVRRALERVGEDVAGVLGRAHETAERITEQSREEAEERLAEAHRDAERITATARRRLQDLDAETDRIWVERNRVVEDLRVLAEELLRMADSAAERAPVEQEEVPAADPPAEAQAEAAEQPDG
ncbi:MAG TPA: DivIVA domain-containing protein [Gaiellales bacterium]|nr:DivIVA domain-containing protein [Gaiellales bacterium]